MNNNKNQKENYPSFTDYRLTKLVLQDPIRCSSIYEYSFATGIPAANIVEEFYRYCQDASIAFEAADGEIFVNTSPHKRACEHTHYNFSQNLWEIFRQSNDVEKASRVFKIYRGMELAGWRLEYRPQNIPMDYSGKQSELALKVGNLNLPLILFPNPKSLDKKNSVLTQYAKTKLPIISMLIEEGSLDLVLSYSRKWFLETSANKNLDILILEAPTFNPYILSGTDGSLQARSATLSYLNNHNL